MKKPFFKKMTSGTQGYKFGNTITDGYNESSKKSIDFNQNLSLISNNRLNPLFDNSQLMPLAAPTPIQDVPNPINIQNAAINKQIDPRSSQNRSKNAMSGISGLAGAIGTFGSMIGKKGGKSSKSNLMAGDSQNLNPNSEISMTAKNGAKKVMIKPKKSNY